MFFNQNELFSDGQAVTVTAISTNVIRWPATGTPVGNANPVARRIGQGNPIPIIIQVIEAFATLTSLTVTLEDADNAALDSNNVVRWTSGAVPVASLVAGYRFDLRFLPESLTKEYLGLRYTVTGTTATAGKITAGLVAARDS